MDLSKHGAADAPRTLTETERAAILEREIQPYLAQGFRVLSRTPSTAQLVKPKSFNAGCAILGAIFLLIGLVIYVLIYMAQKDTTVHLTVDEYGKVTRMGDAAVLPGSMKAKTNEAGEHICPRCGHANPPKQRRACEQCNLALFL